MKKLALAFILILILTTSLVKNSTKEIEDKTFNINETIKSLEVELGDGTSKISVFPDFKFCVNIFIYIYF